MLRSVAAAAFGAFILSVSGVAHSQSCPANIPHVTGTWDVLPYQMPINPIQAVLLHTGKVLIVAGSENDARNNSKGADSYRAAVWDPAGTDLSSIAVQNLSYDVFCSGTASLPDGRALVVGGTLDYTSGTNPDYTFTGENRSSIFDPNTGLFAQTQNMHDGRWYAGTIALGDGRMMAMSGLMNTGAVSTTVEIYDLHNAATGWNAPTSVPFTPPLFPRLTVLPNGNVFFNGQGQGNPTASSMIFNPANGAWTASARVTANRTNGSTVLLPLLPPTYTPRIMNFGGGPNPALKTTEIIDLSAATPSWSPGPSMSTSRIQMNAVILPNGLVLAEGGSVNNEAPDNPGKTADLYDPVANTMQSGGTAAYSRLYHSTALLLPDATVMSLGSNPGSRGSYEAAIEIYTPPYLFDANDRLITTNRPSITGVSSSVLGYGANFSVTTTSTSPIAKVVLIRLGSVTHSFDIDQRLVGLCGPSPQPACTTTNNTINLVTPPNGNIAPPGYYMLFALDSAGVPSKAQIVQLTPYTTAPPTATISSPPGDVTITAGGSVSFATTTTAATYAWVIPGGSTNWSTAQNPGDVTFSEPGVYRASLRVMDAAGNSDPSPPTRTITVNPPTPDFWIEVVEPAKQVFPGNTATFTVKVTPVSGFTGAVNLSVGSESGFPTGVSSMGFSPATITGSGQSTLTMSADNFAVPWATSLTVTGVSGTLSHTASTSFLVNLAPPANVTATPGNGQVALSWSASTGASSYQVKGGRAGPEGTLFCPVTTNWTDTGLNNGTTYAYTVSAAFTGNPNAGGESAPSQVVSAAPNGAGPGGSGPTLPPANLTTRTTKPNSVDLQWTASTTPGVSRYSIYRRTSSSGSYPSTPVASLSGTSYRDGGLVSRTTYCYVVTATAPSGQSGYSNESCAKSK